MAQPLALVPDVESRLGYTLDSAETGMAQGALEDASEMARGYGSAGWTEPGTCPALVRTYVLRAVVRYMRNPDGYVQSRAGDETLVWAEKGSDAGSVSFTDDEIASMQELAGKKGGLYSVEISAHGPQRKCDSIGYVPSGYGLPSSDFPLFPSTDPEGFW